MVIYQSRDRSTYRAQLGTKLLMHCSVVNKWQSEVRTQPCNIFIYLFIVTPQHTRHMYILYTYS